jgi:hypothetical protein
MTCDALADKVGVFGSKVTLFLPLGDAFVSLHGGAAQRHDGKSETPYANLLHRDISSQAAARVYRSHLPKVPEYFHVDPR